MVIFDIKFDFFSNPGEEWDRFVSQYSDLIFHQSSWAKVLKESFGCELMYFYYRVNGEIVAGFPSIILKFGPFKVLYSSIPYGGIIAKKGYQFSLWRCLLFALPNIGVDQVRIIRSPFAETSEVRFGFGATGSMCTFIDLPDNEEDMLSRYGHYLRRDIKRAQKHDLSVEEARTENDIRWIYKLYLESMKRNSGTVKYPFTYFMEIFRHPDSKCLVVVDEYGDNILAGIILMHSGTATHAMLTGSDSSALNLHPNKLLIHKAILEAIRHGSKTFDFMGSALNDKELLRFKEQFGGRSFQISTYVKDYTLSGLLFFRVLRLVASSRFGAGVIRKVWKR